MKIAAIVTSLLIASLSVSCTTLSADNERVNQLQNHSVRKGDTKETVIAKIGQPLIRRTDGAEETWIYSRNNQRGLHTAIAPAMMIPIAGVFVAANQGDKYGGQQSSTLTVVFNSSGRVKSANAVKTQNQSGLSM